MRTRPDPVRAEVVNRRLELLRAEVARDWRATEVDAPSVSAAEAPATVPRGAAPAASADVAAAPWSEGHTRVAVAVPTALRVPAALRAPATADPTPATEAIPAVPVPGRHAARRATAAALVPDQLRGRVALGPWQLAVVTMGVALALAVACWWVARSSATSASSPELASISSMPLVSLSPAAAPSASASALTGATPTARTVTVDIEGTVRRPGVAVLPTGARVIDAIRAAGGTPRRRDLTGLNLAAALVDGQQIVVGPGATSALGSTGAAGGAAESATTGSTAPVALVDLNTATAEQLDTLPGVGPVTARSIIEWRVQNGGFSAVDDLLSVTGIGPATLAKIAPFVTV